MPNSAVLKATSTNITENHGKKKYLDRRDHPEEDKKGKNILECHKPQKKHHDDEKIMTSMITGTTMMTKLKGHRYLCSGTLFCALLKVGLYYSSS